MGKKNGKAKAKRWEGNLHTLPEISSRDHLAACFAEAAPSLCALLENALLAEDQRTREAATWLARDLRSIFHATSAMLDGQDAILHEFDHGDLDAPDRVIDLSRLLQVAPPHDPAATAAPAEELGPARQLIGARLESLAVALRDGDRAEARG